MLTCALAAALLIPTVGAADYFPLTPGTKWSYQEEGKYIATRYVYQVGEPVEFGGEKAWPIHTVDNGKASDPVFYRISQDTIWIVSYDPKKALDAPRPLFKLGSGKETWEYSGTTPFMNDPVPIKLQGESAHKGKRKVLGIEAECLEIKLTAQLGHSEADLVVSKQTALYAKGIGLVEMTSSTTVGKRNDVRKMKLVEFVPAP